MCICKAIYPRRYTKTSLAPLRSPSRPCQSVTSHLSRLCSNGSHYSFVFTCSSTYKCMNSSVFASFCSIQYLWNICILMQVAVVSPFFFFILLPSRQVSPLSPRGRCVDQLSKPPNAKMLGVPQCHFQLTGSDSDGCNQPSPPWLD